MKVNRSLIMSVAFGMLLGALLVVGIGARSEKAPRPKTDPNSLKIVAYPNGVTGFFEPETGNLYMYAVNLENCYAVYHLKELGKSFDRISP